MAARPSMLAASLLCAACSTTPGLTVAVAPTTIVGDGETPITVTAHVTRGGGPVDGAKVHLATNFGTFKDTEAADGLSIDVDSSTGDAVATLYPPRRGRGILEITASTTVDSVGVTAKGQGTLTPAGGLANTLTFTCDTLNVGGFVAGRTAPIQVLCHASAFDKNGRAIQNASIEAYAEAGRLEWLRDATTGTQSLVYTIDPGATGPVDVLPFDGNSPPAQAVCSAACASDPDNCPSEPCWVDSSGATHNPRDGLATLMVAVPGVAGFFDTQANGEPFIDADDDISRSPQEAFIDVNGNGRYDSADSAQGKQQDVRMLWRSTRILWTGVADQTATAHGSRLTGAVSGKGMAGKLQLWDRNFNKVAANGAPGADSIALEATCSAGGTATLTPTTLGLVQQTTGGIALDQDGNISLPQSASAYRKGVDYSFNAQLGADDASQACTFTATLTRDYAPTGFQNDGSLSTEVVTSQPIQF